MQSEVEGDQPKKSGKGKSKKNNVARLTWLLVIWLLLNSIWTVQNNIGSTNEVQRSGLAVIPSHPFEVPNMLGTGKSVQFELSCTFTDRIENRTESIIVGWELRDVSGSIINEWNGSINSSSVDCISYQTYLEPGQYTINTHLPEREGYVNVDMEFKMWVFKSFAMEGYVIANILGVLFLINEITFKRDSKKKASDEWESKEIVDSKSELEIHQFDIDVKSNLSEDQEKSRKAYEDEMRKLSEEAKKKESEKEMEKTSPAELDSGQESLGTGTTKGLDGKAKIDKNIQTVSDLYDLMKKKK